jgi:predicted RNase H-like nuclease (RuvC/YqgF family)
MIKSIAFLIATISAVNFSAIAESVENPLDGIQVCAAVMPCNEQGVIQEFLDGPCAKVYEEQCNIAAQSDRNKSSATLKSENRRLNQRVNKYRREVQSLRAQLLRANHTNSQLRARLAATK